MRMRSKPGVFASFILLVLIGVSVLLGCSNPPPASPPASAGSMSSGVAVATSTASFPFSSTLTPQQAAQDALTRFEALKPLLQRIAAESYGTVPTLDLMAKTVETATGHPELGVPTDIAAGLAESINGAIAGLPASSPVNSGGSSVPLIPTGITAPVMPVVIH